MNSSPMALRFSSGSMTPASRSKNRSAARTWMSSMPKLRRNVSTTCSPSSWRIRPVSTNTHVSWGPMALCTRAAATAESTPPDSPQMARPRADLGPHGLDLLLDDRRHRPRRPAPAGVVEEALEQLLAVRRVDDLGVELHAVEARARATRTRRPAWSASTPVTAKPVGRRGDGVEVAHPDDLVAGAGRRRRGCRRSAPTASSVRPYSPRPVLATSPPRSRAMSWPP